MAEEKKYSILVVEDEEAILRMVSYNLESAGYNVLQATDGEEALDIAVSSNPDVILLDWMLPSLSGLEVCKELREYEATRAVPIIMLTARGEEEDMVKGLNSGADDYIVKPFSPNELMARLNAVLRRSSPEAGGKVFEFEGMAVDMAGHTAKYNGELIKLGPTEFRLLVALIEHPSVVHTREHLLETVWGYDTDVELRTVDTHILRLRKAMDTAHKGLGKMVSTVRSAGYKLENI